MLQLNLVIHTVIVRKYSLVFTKVLVNGFSWPLLVLQVKYPHIFKTISLSLTSIPLEAIMMLLTWVDL